MLNTMILYRAAMTRTGEMHLEKREPRSAPFGSKLAYGSALAVALALLIVGADPTLIG